MGDTVAMAERGRELTENPSEEVMLELKLKGV